MSRLPITYLFVPGNGPERFEKAIASGADAIIVDLEDGVAPGDKDRARAHLRDWIGGREGIAERVLVRINDATTPWFDTDLALLREGRILVAMLPKAETTASIDAVRAALPPAGRVIPIIETARGVRDVDALAAAGGVARLAFGTLDYCADLGLSGDDRGLIHASSRIAEASRCAGIDSPIAGVTPAIDDDARLRADLDFARAFGCGAKLCIHPRQVAVIHHALKPSPEELDWARRVLAAAASGQGAVQLDGRMVDRPVVLRAQSIVDRAST